MNHVQKISQDLVCRKLKLQMGLDPELDIEPQMLRQMWAQLERERRLSAHHREPKPKIEAMDRAA